MDPSEIRSADQMIADQRKPGPYDELPSNRQMRRAGRRWRRRPQDLGTRGGQLAPSAREWFKILRPAVLAARPVVGETRTGQPIYGRSTFRNVIGGDPE